MVTCTTFDDPLHHAIYHAAMCARDARQAVYSATSSGDTPAKLMRAADRFERRVSRNEFCDPGFEHEVHALALDLLDAAHGEHRTVLICDECYVGTDPAYRIMTERGEALMLAHNWLSELEMALGAVQRCLLAEELADRLRQGIGR